MIINKELLQKKFGKNLSFDEKLSKYNWFNLGGPADIFYRPENESQLKEFLKEMNNSTSKVFILGAGSNTLIRDSGIKGIVIKLGSKFSEIKKIDDETIEVGAAALDRKVSDFAKDNNIGNMEFLSCIPGSVGGAITMNSGCYGYDISQILKSVKVLDRLGNTKNINKEEINFFYRGTNISSSLIILSAVLKGKVALKSKIEIKQREYIDKKKETQPSRVKTGGSTFKNNGEKKAWSLIKEAGCDKMQVGDAMISEKHCNFFINNGKAKSSDIETLIAKVKKQVLDKTGVKLDLEIKIIGNEK